MMQQLGDTPEVTPMEFTTEIKHWQARKASPLWSKVAQAHSVEDPLEASPLCSHAAPTDSVEDPLEA